jgi:hypothetical protein
LKSTIHEAIVRMNADPEHKGRVQVECSDLVEGQNIPIWIMPEHLHSEDGGGGVFIPTVGSVVELIEYEDDGAPYQGLLSVNNSVPYRWRPAPFVRKAVPSALQTNYPNRRGWQTPKGHFIIIDDSTGDILIQHTSGMKIQLNNDGKVVIEDALGGALPVGRVGDSVAVPIAAGQFSIPNLVPPFIPETLPCPATTLTGTITSGSAKVSSG